MGRPVRAGMNDGPAISRAMLALIFRAFDMAGRDRQRHPTLGDPSRIVDVGSVVVAGDFTADGPIEASGRGRMQHGGFSRCSFDEEPAHALRERPRKAGHQPTPEKERKTAKSVVLMGSGRERQK